MIVVSNATPLITLAKVGYFDLLQKLFAEITISKEVWNEVVVNGASRSGSVETAQAGLDSGRVARELDSVTSMAELIQPWRRRSFNYSPGKRVVG